jgi:triosephosphate isomerase
MSFLRKVFIGGNWKSNGDLAFLNTHLNVLKSLVFDPKKCEVSIAPTLLHLLPVKKLVEDNNLNLLPTAQNVSMFPEGAYTGEVTAKMLKNADINWTIIGHSERRQYFLETNEIVGKKVNLSLTNNLSAIVCIGEKLEDRNNGKTMEVCLGQMEEIVKNVTNWDKVVIAYEPVWAIGTGKTATKEQAQEVHGELRNYLEKKVSKETANSVRIIYGGSVTQANAKELILEKDIDGFLVGGASLKPEFKTIVESHIYKH